MSRHVWLVLGLSLVLAGCKQAPKEEEQYDDSRNPFYKQAQQDLDGNNPNAAIGDYESALAADSKLAGAHYNLGLIYADKLNDPVAALYHFRRYLQMAPNSDKADEVKSAIDKQSQAFVATLPAAAPSADVTSKLQADNASLKKQVEDATHTIVQLQGQLAKASKHHNAGPTGMAMAVPPPTVQPPPPAIATPASGSAPAVASTTPVSPVTNAAPATPAAPPRAMPVDAATAAAPAPSDTSAVAVSSGPARSYKIVSGDSLWKISHKMYPGDTKNGIEKIKAANTEVLAPGKPLKIGQVLVIP